MLLIVMLSDYINIESIHTKLETHYVFFSICLKNFQ